MRKLCSALVVFLLLSAIFSSCNSSDTPSIATDTTNSAPTSTQPATEDRLYPDVPDKDYEGYEFRFLTRHCNTDADWIDFQILDIYAESENGDVINDATYRRNKAVEDKYNVVIKEISMNFNNGEFDKTLRATVQTGDNGFDAVMPQPVLARPYVMGGYFINLYEVPYLKLSNPWWNQRGIKDLSIDGKLYYVFGDISTVDEDATSAVLFNKTVLADFGLEDPYELVRNGKWTFDKMLSMMKGVSQDIDNDGKMGESDRFAFIGQVDTMWSLYSAAGERFVGKDDKDKPVITFGDDRSLAVSEKIFDIMYDNSQSLNGHKLNKFNDIVQGMFSENRALFKWSKLNVVRELRAMEGDFGILPCPKYDEAQEEYYSLVTQHTTSYIAVPQSAPDLERTGIILEAMAAESKYTLVPAYYDQALTQKYARDEESKEMLDIIFAGTVFDIGLFYDFGTFPEDFAYLSLKDNRNVVSAFEKKKDVMQQKIDKFTEDYSKLD
ncbi:MAG: hypothetical protein AB9835_07470 [Eubacteriales bacterium]